MDTTETNPHAGLPEFPGARAGRCPFDPPPAHAEWREAEGLQQASWHGAPVHVTTRYEDIRQVLADPRVSADFQRPDFPGYTPENAAIPPTFPRMDDPEHARLRRMLTKDFTIKKIDQKRPEIRKLVDEHLDRMLAKGGPLDLVTEYALPIPSLVISVLLGVPYEEAEFFQEHSETINHAAATPEEKQAAQGELFGFLLGLVDRKMQDPADDLISRLVTEQVATGQIPRETAAMTGIVLLIAGHETTANMIALGTLALLRHPEQAALLRETDDDKVVANAVEELLRYLSVAQDVIVRVADEDLEIGGQLVKAGEGLAASLPAGNRDTSVFTDPDVLDLGRVNARSHVAFGYGIHQCIGQGLARAELQIALPALLRRLPDLRLAVPFEDLRFRDDMAVYGVQELPVTW
jgi:cytochrome P450